MDQGLVSLRRVLKRKATQIKLNTTELMKQELGGYPSFNFEKQTNQLWGSVAMDILKVNENDNIGNIPRKSQQFRVQIEDSFSSSESSSSDDTLIQLPSIMDSTKAPVSVKPRFSIRKQKRLNKKANKNPQQWNVEYHQTFNNQRQIRNASVYARNKDEAIWMLQNLVDFRRKSCEFQDEGQIGIKQKTLANIIVEIQMEKKKRLANILIQSLKKSSCFYFEVLGKVSTIGKHNYNARDFTKWAIHVKAANHIKPTVIKRSTSHEEDISIIIENNRQSIRVPLNELKRSSSKYKTIQLPDKMTGFQFLHIPLDKKEDIIISPCTSPIKQTKLNKAQLQVYQPKYSKCMTEMSSISIKSFTDIIPNKDKLYHSSHNKINSPTNNQINRFSVRTILPPVLQKSSFSQFQPKSSNLIGVYHVNPLLNKKKSYDNFSNISNSPTKTQKIRRKNISNFVNKV